MRIFRHIATTTAFSLTLLAGAQGFAGADSQAHTGQSQTGQSKTGQSQASQPQKGQPQVGQPEAGQSKLGTGGQAQAPAQPDDQQAPYGGTPLTSDQLGKEYQNLSPATRTALTNQLKSKGLDGLSKMNEADARTAFSNLPPDVKAQIQAKWDSLSDEQRIALKKMGPAAVKELVAAQMKEAMKESMSPITKPVEQVVATVQQVADKLQSAADKAKAVMQKGRDFVQGLIAKMKGESSPPPEGGQAGN